MNVDKCVNALTSPTPLCSTFKPVSDSRKFFSATDSTNQSTINQSLKMLPHQPSFWIIAGKSSFTCDVCDTKPPLHLSSFLSFLSSSFVLFLVSLHLKPFHMFSCILSSVSPSLFHCPEHTIQFLPSYFSSFAIFLLFFFN